jgi:hypothetical protein
MEDHRSGRLVGHSEKGAGAAVGANFGRSPFRRRDPAGPLPATRCSMARSGAQAATRPVGSAQPCKRERRPDPSGTIRYISMILGFTGTGAIAAAIVSGLNSEGGARLTIRLSPRNVGVAAGLASPDCRRGSGEGWIRTISFPPLG